MADQNDDARAFLMGGGGPKSAFTKFDRPGTTKGGVILEWDYSQQRDMKTNEPKFWNDGNKMMQLIITVQGVEIDPAIENDDGKRRLFAKGEMTKAIRAALKNESADFIAKGGTLWVRYEGDGPSAGPGLDGAKLYAASYVLPPIGYGTVDPKEDVAPVSAPVGPPVATGRVAPVQAEGRREAGSSAEQAAVTALVDGGLVTAPAGAAALAASTTAAPVESATAPAAGSVPPDLAAALAALTPEQRAQMGIPA